MSSKNLGPISFMARTIHTIFADPSPQPRRKKRPSQKLRLEGLEDRAMMASDLAAISGLVYRDLTGNGFNAGEQVAGATVQLYRDNGDGVLNTGSDAPVGSMSTNSEGNYRFDQLTAGGYFVQQQPITFGNITLAAKTSSLILITAADADGTVNTVIDSFDATQQIAKATSSVKTNSSNLAAPEAIGGHRKLAVALDQNVGTVALTVHDPDSGLTVLDYSSTSTASGSRRVTWDGGSGAGDTLNAAGLGGIDLTQGGLNTGIATVIGADKLGMITLRLYSDANNFSSATVEIPNTGGAATAQVYVPFSGFVAAGGNGATLTSIGAIQLDVAANTTAADGQIDAIDAIGPTVKTQNFDNLTADLELTKTVNNPAPNLGGNVTFSITVGNTGGLNATGVRVSDVLPAGLSYVSSTASQGSYESGTGVWTVGNVDKGASKNLQITATVTATGTKTNVAQVSAADQQDIDSIPANNIPSEDDQASVSLTPAVIDLSLTKTVNNTTPNVGQDVTFTITVRNDGPNGATNVAVADPLPAGLTYQTDATDTGVYNNATGVWTVGALANGASATLSLVARLTTAGAKTNTAQVSAADQSDIDSTPNNNLPAEDDQASVSLTPPVADLSLTKTIDVPQVVVGQNVNFTVTVRNDGPNNATGVLVADALPAGLTFQSFTASVGGYNNATGTWTVGALNTGASATLNIVAKATTPGITTNTAQVSAADQADIDSTPDNNNPTEDDQASAPVTVIPRILIPPPPRLSKLRFLAR